MVRLRAAGCGLFRRNRSMCSPKVVFKHFFLRKETFVIIIAQFIIHYVSSNSYQTMQPFVIHWICQRRFKNDCKVPPQFEDEPLVSDRRLCGARLDAPLIPSVHQSMFSLDRTAPLLFVPAPPLSVIGSGNLLVSYPCSWFV